MEWLLYISSYTLYLVVGKDIHSTSLKSDLTWSHFIVGSHVQRETQTWLLQKMLDLIGIFPLGCLRHQATNSSPLSRYCQKGRPLWNQAFSPTWQDWSWTWKVSKIYSFFPKETQSMKPFLSQVIFISFATKMMQSLS